jgi:transcriptional regulator with XRE-family HTH domain
MMMHRHSNICKILREARHNLGYTLLEVANESGLSISTIVNSERKIPSPRTIQILSKIYKIKVSLAQKRKGNIVYL